MYGESPTLANSINGKVRHFSDGPEQQIRDEAMRPIVERRDSVSTPNRGVIQRRSSGATSTMPEGL